MLVRIKPVVSLKVAVQLKQGGCLLPDRLPHLTKLAMLAWFERPLPVMPTLQRLSLYCSHPKDAWRVASVP